MHAEDLKAQSKAHCNPGPKPSQVVLKALSFVYNQEVLFHGAFRIKLINGVLLKGFFFQLFLHWMHEIRKYFLHILVFKVTARLADAWDLEALMCVCVCVCARARARTKRLKSMCA